MYINIQLFLKIYIYILNICNSFTCSFSQNTRVRMFGFMGWKRVPVCLDILARGYVADTKARGFTQFGRRLEKKNPKISFGSSNRYADNHPPCKHCPRARTLLSVLFALPTVVLILLFAPRQVLFWVSGGLVRRIVLLVAEEAWHLVRGGRPMLW